MPLVTENLVAQIGQQQEGFLIRPQDWNLLVKAVADAEAALAQRIGALEVHVQQEFDRVGVRIDALEQEVADRFDQVEARFATVEARVGMLEAELRALTDRVETLPERMAALEAKVEPVVQAAYAVTMHTPRQDFALGEMAELVARISYLPGAAPGPLSGKWVTFVCTSGTFRPADGFVSRGGVGDRTISVQTDARGEARVRLQSDLVDDMPLADAEELSSALQTRVGTQNRSVSELILRSETPEDEDVKAAYRVLTGKYDREDSSLRGYVDAYYLKHDRTIGPVVQGPKTPTRPQWIQRWRDYRITVMAFATDDADPTTADPSRGTSSIQVVFRDWVRNWLVIDYWDRVRDVAVDYRDRLVPKVDLTLERSVDLMRKEVTEIVKDRGVVGRLRDYQAIDVAFDTLTVPDRPEFLPTLSKSMKAAVGIQRSLEQNPAGILGSASQELVFQAFTRSATPIRDDRVDDLSLALEELNGELGSTTSELEGRLETLGRQQTEFLRAGDVDLRIEAAVPQQVDVRLQSLQSTLPSQIDSRINAIVPGQIQTRLITILPEQIDGRLEQLLPSRIETQVRSILPGEIEAQVTPRLTTLEQTYNTRIGRLEGSVDLRITTLSSTYDQRINSLAQSVDRTAIDLGRLSDTQTRTTTELNSQLFQLSRSGFTTTTTTPIVTGTREIK
ncbi:MAG TPA: hypothetical protein VFR37_11380 [Longimicrobium sp.]|nr:hypothetical protein [Longimicrobium sp.]